MPKTLKIILVSALSLLLLIVIIIGGIFLFVDPNEYKGEIAAVVQKATGRQLTVEGDIHFSIYPWLGITIGATQLSNADGFGDAPFASVKTVDVKVKLIPLFQQRLEMQKIRLHELRANLSRNKEGLSNWDDLVKSETSGKQPETSAQKANEPLKAMEALGTLAIDGLELENAHLEWNDLQANQQVIISQLTLRTGPLALPAPVDLTLSLNVKSNNPELNSQVNFSGQVSFDLDNQQYYANNLDLSVKATGNSLPISPVDARLLANVTADLKQQQLTLSDLTVNTLDTNLRGNVNITNLDQSPSANGQIEIANFSPKQLANKLGIALPETSDPSVLNSAIVDMKFSGNSNKAQLTSLSIVLDDSKLTGTASVKNFNAPAIRFSLHVNEIDLDRYLPSTTDLSTNRASTPPASGSAAATAAATQLPLEPLRALDVEGQFKLDKLKVTGARSTDININVNAKKGMVRLHPVNAKLYNGTYKGNIGLDIRTDTPKLSFSEALSGVNVGPLLKDTVGKELVSGTANAKADLTATGTELSAIKKTLNGKANFNFRDGKVNGVNIGQMLREANAKLNKKPVPPKTVNETDFAEMSGSVTITNGSVRNNDLIMKSPLLRIHGKGHVDLPKEKIKYLVNTSIVESNEGQTGKELSELKSLTIPIKVTGTFDKPKFSLDLGRVLQEKAKIAADKKKKQLKKEVDKKIKAEKKKIRKKLEDELKKKLGL